MSNFHEKISTWSFGAVIVISILALAGWLANFLSLAGMGENSIPMAPVTLICFFLISLAALNLLQRRFKPALSWVILFSVLVLCLIVLFDMTTGYSIEFERIFGNSPGSLNNFPIGRMSPVTSILFLIGTISLLVISTKNNWHKAAMLLSTTALFAAFTFGLGYLYGAPLLYGRNIIPPAWNTSLAFTFLFIGILMGFGMNEKPLNLFVGDTVRARLMRGFLPLTLLLIIIAGWIDVIFIHIFSDPVLISALVTIISLLALSFIILKMAKNIGNDIDHLFAFRKEAENALRESEIHFRTLADSGQALIWTSGLDKKCNYFNQPWLDFTGRSLEQELGDGWVEGVHPDDLNRCFETYTSAFEQRQRFSMDYRLRYNDGTYRWIQDNGTPRFNSQNEFIGYIGHCLDITERKSVEESLLKSEERYHSTLDNMMEGCQIIGFDWKYIYLNKAAEKHNRRPNTELLHQRVMDVWPGFESTDIFELERNCMENRTAHQKVTEFVFADGEKGYFDIRVQPVPEGIFILSQDITDKKNAEEKLVLSELRFRELLEKVNLMAIVLDSEGKVTFCNDYALKLTEYNHDELIEKNWFELMIPQNVNEAKIFLANGLITGNIPPRYENPIITKSGKILDIMWSNVFQRGSDNKFSGIASIGEDITEQKMARNKINELNIDLENRVLERTRELEEKNAELTRMNKLFVGRELRMIELKNKIKELETLNKIQKNN